MSGGPRATTAQRTLGARVLVAIVYSAVTSAVYFSLGVVADHALGLTPLVFLLGGIFFALCTMTYVEGASLHPERGGSTVFARYAFNELWSFVAAWALLLDYILLIAVCAFAAINYLAAFWSPLGDEGLQLGLSVAVVAFVAVVNVAGLHAERFRRLFALVVVDLGLQLALIVLGLVLLFDPGVLTAAVDLGGAPAWSELLFAVPLTAVALTGLESASGLAGEVQVGRRDLRRLVAGGTLVAVVVYVGIALVALSAVPVDSSSSAFGGGPGQEAPLLAVAGAFTPGPLADGLRLLVGASAFFVLVAAANSAMLGLSRLSYSLATNRQIPSALGRLHPRRATPYVAIGSAAVLAAGLLVPQDLDFLVGLYAFGAMVAFALAHVSVCALRYREPDRPRPYRIPLSVRVGGGELPLPAVLGALLAVVGWACVVGYHQGARTVGPLWMVGGLALYVIYRKTQGKPLFKRVRIPEAALRREPAEVEYGSILVPLTGGPLDDDIMQTAGRLASEDRDLTDGEPGAMIEALWVIEVPMSLPIDARLPDAQLARARARLARAKAVGEEYGGVEVATATVRARRAGQAIVDQARRRGVEAIVLAAEEPSRVRGGALFGGVGGARDTFVGEATKYVLAKAPCRVILTAPAAEAVDRPPPPAARAPSGGSDGAAAGAR